MLIKVKTMFDIYLYKGCETLPNVAEMAIITPGFISKEFFDKLLVDYPGFLEVNLPISTAKKLLGILKNIEFRGRGQVIPVEYRDNPPPILDEEMAFHIADKYLKEIQSTTYSNLHFDKTVYASAHSSLMYFTFAASAYEWQEAGLIPGAIFTSVDKLMGIFGQMKVNGN